jgi:hypothetical protein
VLQANPQLLDIPVRSGNWGPPMSHAANLGKLEIVQAIAALGARDFQHAFDRALLQGELACAGWLHQHGAKLVPGIVMGTCETLHPEGLSFLVELKAPFTNEQGDPFAPLALALETYCRNRAGKHAILEIFARQGYQFPDTPIMAFHRGQIDRLKHISATIPRCFTGASVAARSTQQNWAARRMAARACTAHRWRERLCCTWPLILRSTRFSICCLRQELTPMHEPALMRRASGAIPRSFTPW